MFDHIKQIHFVGIGGSGMSGIAEVLINLGYRVTGSDLKSSEVTDHLKKIGAKNIFIGKHTARNVGAADVVVVSSAVSPQNPEVAEARRRKIPVIPRIEMLAEIARLKYTIAVAGTHGKTTTTSLVSLVLTEGGKDPTIIVGGRLKNISSGAKLGQGDYLVAEADESDGSFLKLSPAISIVTNIDDDHMDYYGTMEKLKNSFAHFINKVPFYGCAILEGDDKNIRSILPLINRRYITYGLSERNDYSVKNFHYLSDGKIAFSLIKNGRNKIGDITLSAAGRHNALNAAAAAICGIELGIPFSKIKRALASFGGVARRMEIKYRRGGNNAPILIDDYGHHPTEISATIKAVGERFHPKRLIVIFQPHRYTRTKILYREIAASLVSGRADEIKLMDIYPAAEKPIRGVTSKLIFDEILKLKKDGVRVSAFSNSSDEIEEFVRTLKKGDLVLTLGAGDITKLSDRIAIKLSSTTTD